MRHLSRRAFALSSLSAGLLRGQSAAITAGEVVDRIKANVGVDWSERTVDNIIVGSPDTKVRGIAATMMATLDVLERAAAAGKNMVVTHESTFFSHRDDVEQLAEDETYLYKKEFAERNDMVVFHFHDHWHRRRPDGIAVGMAREMGWEEFAAPDNPRRFTLPPTKLADIARQVSTRLDAGTVRVLGDPGMTVRNVRASWGYVSQFPGTDFIAEDGVDLLIVGETREWELVEYVADMAASGKNKALILIGHIASEQAGMKHCASWMATFVPEVPVVFIPAKEPFWTPPAAD